MLIFLCLKNVIIPLCLYARLGKVVDKEKVQKEGIPAYFKPPHKHVEENKDITTQVSQA